MTATTQQVEQAWATLPAGSSVEVVTAEGRKVSGLLWGVHTSEHGPHLVATVDLGNDDDEVLVLRSIDGHTITLLAE